jgi:hypothetical protein
MAEALAAGCPLMMSMANETAVGISLKHQNFMVVEVILEHLIANPSFSQ